MTDYSDSQDQSKELKQISGEYKFEFLYLIKPYANDRHIEIREHDDIDEDFVVKDPNSYYYYYLAAIKQPLNW